eukprot:CAMPEP_0119146220 /NCGR_PEP_ID=MMETSP1310-20130426/38576_1 /TAXON_ID=464262 /ORGANISM="Genus nov. species nov., Strain RCC2339" /LENGTH=277 /DNA_ID=CAMNT_0007138091 /DNA_START=230 /DNA_END=1060 /DNA_ORIENTATION=+
MRWARSLGVGVAEAVENTVVVCTLVFVGIFCHVRNAFLAIWQEKEKKPSPTTLTMHRKRVEALQMRMRQVSQASARFDEATRESRWGVSAGGGTTGANKSARTTQTTYRSTGLGLGVKSLISYLRIDTLRRLAVVEPGITYEELVKICGLVGMVPQIVPEFRHITVGGAICGGGCESTSFRFGQVSDTCVEMDVLLGNGDILTASEEQNRDLFYGVQNSYGSLGIVTRAVVRLRPCKSYVLLTYRFAKSVKEALQILRDYAGDTSVEYLDAIIFDRD